MESNCIVLNSINKYFGKKHVLKDINMQIPYGRIYGLLGPSGCGKTTVVKIAAGILEATSGEARVLDTVMPNLNLMNKIGYMAQSDAIYLTLTAAENMMFFGALYGMGKSEIKKRMVEVMDLVDLTKDLHTPVQNYSGGMKRRLSLAIALLNNPTVLLLDEPTVGIDPLLRKNIWNELENMVRQGLSILITTHVMDEAEKCHCLAMMRDGRLIAEGTPEELEQRSGAASIEEAFLYYGGNEHES